MCPQLSCCNPTLVLQALPTNRQLLEIEALLCCNPAFGLQALPTTGALLYYSEKKTVAIPHSGCRLFRLDLTAVERLQKDSCNPAFGLQALPTVFGDMASQPFQRLQSRIRAAGSSDHGRVGEPDQPVLLQSRIRAAGSSDESLNAWIRSEGVLLQSRIRAAGSSDKIYLACWLA